ncbi:MAG: MaoC/PaaZ C-terminal domain-containing protein [Acidimicrobiia bacterium]
MNPAELLDVTIGPHPFRVCVENVSDFVEVTGDDRERWTDAAPPGFMAAALFAVASDLLRQLADRSVIHGEQTFTWHRPMVVESQLTVTGSVSRVRERGGVDFVSFDVEVTEGATLIAEASSLFLVSGVDSGVAAEARPEPPPDDDGAPGPGQVGVSRAGLVRYAAATRDWNPIHWDHDAAVAAGLPGVVAHGLLQAAWAFGAASRLRPGDQPLQSARVRFRKPLLPAAPVSLQVEEDGDTAVVAIADGDVEYVSARIALMER